MIGRVNHPRVGFPVSGLPLSEIGLDQAHVLYDNGEIRPLCGFVITGHQNIYNALLNSLPLDAVLYLTKEDAERARDFKQNPQKLRDKSEWI